MIKTILLIVDKKAIADNVFYALESEGNTTEWVTRGARGVPRMPEGA